MSNYFTYTPISGQDYFGTYQLVSEPFGQSWEASRETSSSIYGVRQGSPEEQRRPAEEPQYGWGSPHYNYGWGSHLRSSTPAMESPSPPPPPAPDPYCYQPSTYQQQYMTSMSSSFWNQPLSQIASPQLHENSSTSTWNQQSSTYSPSPPPTPQQQYETPPSLPQPPQQPCQSQQQQEENEPKVFDEMPVRKLGSTSWCRRCKIECESMEGLVIHSLTSEHQNRTMDLVMSIKQNIQPRLLRPYRAREVFDEIPVKEETSMLADDKLYLEPPKEEEYFFPSARVQLDNSGQKQDQMAEKTEESKGNPEQIYAIKSREERILETIVTSGGVRLQPTRDAIQVFLAEALKLDTLAMSHALDMKLQSQVWQGMTTCCVLESIWREEDMEQFSVENTEGCTSVEVVPIISYEMFVTQRSHVVQQATCTAAEIAPDEEEINSNIDFTSNDKEESKETQSVSKVSDRRLFCSYDAEENGQNQLLVRHKHLESELSSTLDFLRSGAICGICHKGQHSSLEELQRLSDAWEFKDTEIGFVAISEGCPHLHYVLYFCRQMTSTPCEKIKSLATAREHDSCLNLPINRAWTAAQESTTMKDEVLLSVHRLLQAKVSTKSDLWDPGKKSRFTDFFVQSRRPGTVQYHFIYLDIVYLDMSLVSSSIKSIGAHSSYQTRRQFNVSSHSSFSNNDNGLQSFSISDSSSRKDPFLDEGVNFYVMVWDPGINILFL